MNSLNYNDNEGIELNITSCYQIDDCIVNQ
jgi:hypothetical protein